MVEESEHEANNQPIVKPPFHQRFNIQINIEEAEERFINRILNQIEQQLSELARLEASPSQWVLASKYRVATRLGIEYQDNWIFHKYVRHNFYNCLLALEALYETFSIKEYKYLDYAPLLTWLIQNTITMSETDLGIEWRDGSFWPSGAKLLDEALLNENLKWLSDQTLHGVLVPFEKGLRHFLEACRQPEKLADTVTDMYEALEAMAKVVTGKDDDLSGNREKFISMLKLSNYYKKMLRDYIEYANQYRHAVKQGEKRAPPKRNEVEAFFYTTGLFIRLSIQQLTSRT